MINYLIPSPLLEEGNAQEERKRFEQRLNSMSFASLEKHFARADLRSGLMRTVLRRPEHKLRDLARKALGQTEMALGELDILQVGRLFYDRRMTFSMDQLTNVAFRRYREVAVRELLDRTYEDTGKKGNILFLIHDKFGNVSVVTMENHDNFYPCQIAPLSEGPLFDDSAMMFILRHPNPHLIWRFRAKEAEEDVEQIKTAKRLGKPNKFKWELGTFMEPSADCEQERAFQKVLEAAYKMQNLDVKVGYGIYGGHCDDGKDERTLFGLPPEIQLDPNLCRLDAWIAEVRGMMAQMGDMMDIPPELGLAAKHRQGVKFETMCQAGLTFSVRETALFMHNAPRLRDSEVYVLFVHDDEGRSFAVTITYRDTEIWLVGVRSGFKVQKLLDWSSHVTVCLCVRFTDSVISISNPRLTDHEGSMLIRMR